MFTREGGKLLPEPESVWFVMMLPAPNLLGNAMKLARITVDPKRMGGVPCIRGLRIPVATVLAMLAEGMAEAEILAAYPDLEPEDIHEAQCYAAGAGRGGIRRSRPGEVGDGDPLYRAARAVERDEALAAEMKE
jgi:uncharacterized protein (DUF433 family)